MTPQYFAQIDADGVVTHVAVVQREFLEANPDRYQGTWVETFIDRTEKTYAGVGFIYDAEAQDFICPTNPAPVEE
jgi:hypothetical protein